GYVFFFQAEDGIRDKLVTGVQTCALPISEIFRACLGGDVQQTPPNPAAQATGKPSEHQRMPQTPERFDWLLLAGRDELIDLQERSEERRVGKECKSRWWAGECKENSRDCG